MGKPTSSATDSAAMANLANVMATTGQNSANQGSTLFNMALPGLESANSYYGKLASGDPSALSRANAPAIQGITQQADSAKKNIVQDTPRGGERNLALDQADIAKGGQISQLQTGSYTNAFPSMAQLAGQNVSQGNAATGTGLSGMSSAAGQYGNLLNINAESKGSTMGFLGSLAGIGGELGAAKIGA